MPSIIAKLKLQSVGNLALKRGLSNIPLKIYVWKYFLDEGQHFYEYALDEFFNPEKILPEDKCIEVRLFNDPENQPSENNNWQRSLIDKYFYEAFEDWAFNERSELKDLITTIIIPKSKYYEILNKINEFELLHIKELLLETIAIAQYIITDELWVWNTPEKRKVIMTAQAETAKAIKVVELSGVHHKSIFSMLDNPSPGLSSITFKFNDKTTIKIQHEYLVEEFVRHLMRYYDQQKTKDWRKDLASYPERFGKSHLKDSFQKQITLAYFKLFTENKWLVSDKRHPSEMMRCIVCMLEFSLSPIGKKNYTEFRKGKNVAELLRQMGH